VLLKQTQAAAQGMGVSLYVVQASAPDNLENAFASITAAQAGALLVTQDVIFFNQYPRIEWAQHSSKVPGRSRIPG
jgi:hypothetical protein